MLLRESEIPRYTLREFGMYVAVSGYGKARVIQFREEKRIPGTNKKKTKVVKTLGNYERMLADDPDILAKLKAEAAILTKDKKESSDGRLAIIFLTMTMMTV